MSDYKTSTKINSHFHRAFSLASRIDTWLFKIFRHVELELHVYVCACVFFGRCHNWVWFLLAPVSLHNFYRPEARLAMASVPVTSGPNRNKYWLNNRGMWLGYLTTVAILHCLILSIPFLTTPQVWTLTHVIHNIVRKGLY